MNFDALFVNPNGRTTRNQFVPALIVLLAALAFYTFLVFGRTAQFCMLVLMYPLFVLLARRLQDLGKSAWLVLIPAVLALIAFAIKLGYASLGQPIDGVATWIALAVSAAFVLWGSLQEK